MTEEKHAVVTSPPRKVFWAMQYSEPFIDVYNECKKQLEAEYDFITPLENQDQTNIVKKVVTQISEADFVVVDVSYIALGDGDRPLFNGNVMFELGYAMTLPRNVIMISCKDKKYLPFDFNAYNVEFYNPCRPSELCAKLKKLLSGSIKFGNPITDWLRESRTPHQVKEQEATEQTAKESPFDVAQLSDAELELLVAVLLRNTPVTYLANKLEFHINDNTVVPFTFDTPLPENQTVNDVLKSLIALNFLEKLGALYRASRLAQEHRDELIARDNKRILDVLLRTSFGKLVLEYADGKAARISVNVSEPLPCDECDIVLQKNGNLEHPQPGFNISTKTALAHEVNAVAVILHKNLLINNWEAQENAGTPPYSQRNLSENSGFPIQTNISPYNGQLIRSGINARNFFSRFLKFDYVTSRLTERGCEISRLYLAWNQGDN